MRAVLDALGALPDYEDAEVTAAATYYMAEVYGDFSRALAESERPADLGPAERQAYEDALEEEAFPFEEKAIAVHEKNLELLATGIYNAWIEKSLARLAERVPGRYARFEASSGFLASIDSYAYQPPPLPLSAPEPPEVVAAPPASSEAARPEAAEVAPPASAAETGESAEDPMATGGDDAAPR
jgi:hypothetical protein